MLFLFSCHHNPVSPTPNNYSLTVAFRPALSGMISISPLKETYEAGEIVTLNAHPDSSHVFYCWGDDVFERSNPISLIMNSNKHITANMPFFMFDTGLVVINGIPDSVVPVGHYALFTVDLNLPIGRTYKVDATTEGSFIFQFFFNQPSKMANIQIGSYPTIPNTNTPLATSVQKWWIHVKDNSNDSLLYQWEYNYSVRWN